MLPMLLIIAGCNTVRPANTAVQIPSDCEALAADVPAPALTSGMDCRVALARTSAALAEARGNLDATRSCQAAQRDAFANPEK